ncbi:putative ATPase/DNA-binding winged helix-turn-helix (wHTH) protein [Rhizobium azooxidifex]|uniref:Putative ATPase/DNA-binding winged helix-turn-helix (WHTH) protein n=1 Tax=Mycoplana azooxidifex TaxID=1636188 RepID=A0A7W6GLM0_9HYPH|nr:winged helix-turn-helix domain-containing protein [Mycoplana azooxidifex]MBB3979547.1 putative ATPase/DNA-binding winged helix-turn-helix (wHTH) protein [Mycoplana azooxidifex]
MSTMRFLDFELDISRRFLTHRGEPVKVGSRALDILAVLASRSGEVISANEILQAVWPGSASAENSLRVHLVALRKALSIGDADSLVQSVAGRGYILSATVKTDVSNPETGQPVPRGKGNLPGRNTSVIGRENFIRRCLDLRQSRVMTIVGTGGIGKTTVALELAHLLSDEYEAVYFLDLAALSSPASIGPTLASLLGLSVYGDDPLPGITAALSDRRIMIVFDNCEHVITDTAQIVESITRTCPNVTVLATSREPLSIHAETIRRLGSLDVPEEGEVSADALQRSAVALFMDRMEHSFEIGAPLDSEQTAIVAAIVRRLEGIPLAIEFAATRVVDLGLKELLASLDRPLTVLRRGRRTAPRRQQTLQATLDWSYGFLTDNEKFALQALSVFAYSFSREGAYVVCGLSLGKEETEDAIWGLQSKSLLARSESGTALRLLETTREYATIKLAASGQQAEARLAHASLLLVRMRQAELLWDKLSTSQWMNGYGILIHDLRLALAFCEETGNFHLLHQLLAASGLLWTQLGLMNEQFRHIERAVKAFDDAPTTDTLVESQLRSAYGSIAYNVHSVAGDIEARRQFELAAMLARSLDDGTKLLRAGSGICALLTTQGSYHEANDVALGLVRDLGPIAEPAVDRILAHNNHYLGRHDDAYAHARRALDANGLAVRGTLTSGASFGQKTLSLMVMAKTAYLRGQIDKSLEHLDELTSDVLAVKHPISTCLGLAVGACPIYFGLGRQDQAHRFLDILRDISTRNSLVRWQEWVDGFDFALRAAHPDDEGVISSLRRGGNGPRLENIVTVAGKKAGIDLIELALAGEAGWCQAELLRLKGEILLDHGETGGRDLLLEGYEIAKLQSALTWQLKCATSLAKHATFKTLSADRERIDRTLALFPAHLAEAETHLRLPSMVGRHA